MHRLGPWSQAGPGSSDCHCTNAGRFRSIKHQRGNTSRERPLRKVTLRFQFGGLVQGLTDKQCYSPFSGKRKCEYTQCALKDATVSPRLERHLSSSPLSFPTKAKLIAVFDASTCVVVPRPRNCGHWSTPKVPLLKKKKNRKYLY